MMQCNFLAVKFKDTQRYLNRKYTIVLLSVLVVLILVIIELLVFLFLQLPYLNIIELNVEAEEFKFFWPVQIYI